MNVYAESRIGYMANINKQQHLLSVKISLIHALFALRTPVTFAGCANEILRERFSTYVAFKHFMHS